MSPYDTAIAVVKDYKRYVVRKSAWWFGQEVVIQRAIEKWATDEALLELQKHPDWPPLETLERLRKQWDDLACLKTGVVGRNFSIAYDTVTDIIDYLVK